VRERVRESLIILVKGGEDPEDALKCRSFSAKKPQIIGLFCGKRPMRIRHPMGLRHPVTSFKPDLTTPTQTQEDERERKSVCESERESQSHLYRT